MKRIDDAVRRILRIKFRAGLFEHPYAPFDPTQAEAADAAAGRSRAPRATLRAARWCCCKNEGAILPLDPAKKTAVIGPLGDRTSTTCSARGGARVATPTR